jgi:hypothetical protein
MKKIIFAATAAIALAGAANAETPTVSQLFAGVVKCEKYAETVGLLNRDDAAACMAVYEALKDAVTVGNYDTSTTAGRNAQYLEYRAWRDANEAAFLNAVQPAKEIPGVGA